MTCLFRLFLVYSDPYACLALLFLILALLSSVSFCLRPLLCVAGVLDVPQNANIKFPLTHRLPRAPKKKFRTTFKASRPTTFLG